MIERRISCKELFKKFSIFLLASESLLSFLLCARDCNTHIGTRYRYNLCVPTTNFIEYQKGVYCTRYKLLIFSYNLILESQYRNVYASSEGESPSSLLLCRRLYVNNNYEI